MACKHSWKVLEKQVLESPYEQFRDHRGTLEGGSIVFQKKVVILVSCEKCGKFKKIVETNPVI